MKIIIFMIALVAIGACSTINIPDIEVKNNTILHNGFDLSFDNFKHEFLINLKSSKDYEINRINYKLMIPNYEELLGTYTPPKKINLRANQSFQEIIILSEETSYFDLCDQMSAMFKSKNDVFSMKVDLEFVTTDNVKISLSNVEIKIKSSTIWDNLRNFVIESGCKVTSLPVFISLIKSIIGG